MNLAIALQLLELALGLAKSATGGNVIIGDIQALEQIAAAVAKQYQELAGKPIDLSLLTYEEPIA